MKIKIILAYLLLGLISESSAELHDRGGGMIYDDVLNITWLQNANLGGSGQWLTAVDWADGLDFGGFSDWRLPSANVDGLGSPVNCSTVNVPELMCRDNEMGYMFYYNLSGGPNDDLTGVQGFFSNIQIAQWSGQQPLGSPNSALVFNFANGDNLTIGILSQLPGAWAVRDGDVISDTDADGVADSDDNCSIVANADQRDTDGDGYGNICDPDLNNDGTVNFTDLTLWVPFFNTATSGDADFNGDGFANFADFGLIPDYFLQPPGPSGVAP